jgi:hypothetical protein
MAWWRLLCLKAAFPKITVIPFPARPFGWVAGETWIRRLIGCLLVEVGGIFTVGVILV